MQDFPLIGTIAVAFTLAWLLGLFTQWLRLSPIVGYLIAGVLIGPHTPGFHGDIHLAHQLAEVGVILLMFGVGLHFHIGDLLAVRAIAIPGAIGQSLAATAAGVGVFALFGTDVKAGAVIGMALAVASTVVLMRVLMDANALGSPAGHVAVGWLLVEDVLTVIVLVLIPVLGTTDAAAVEGFWGHPLVAIGLALGKLAVMIGIVFVAGARFIPWALTQVARLRSRELFTLTVLVFSIALAAGAYALFGASMALGAFLAGMMVAQSPVSHQAAADALPLRDAFAVLFFVSVGMLFDPFFLLREPLMMLATLAVILLLKPLVALGIVIGLGHSVRTALTVALGLAQIGEFSFILTELARKHGLMTDDGHNAIVGAAIVSITLNPLLFRSIDKIEGWLKRRPKVWAFLNARAERRVSLANAAVAEQIAAQVASRRRLALVVGYGPVGQTVDRLLREAGLDTVIIDTNMDTVSELRRQGRTAVFGDASNDVILESAGVAHATHVVLTLPQSADRAGIVATARNRNAAAKIFVRARYISERGELEKVGATGTICEEAEAAVALARLVLADTGVGRESIESAVRDIRTRLMLDNVAGLRAQTVRNVAVPWSRVRRLTAGSPVADVRRSVTEERFSRWPVVEAGSGKPVGYLLAKDLIGVPADGADWSALVRPLSNFRPDESTEAVLQFFQRESATIGVVIDDEVPVGLITIEDILEQVVGRFEDEYPRHTKQALQNLLVTDDALLAMTGRTAEEVIADLAGRIPADRLPADANVGELAFRREREAPTAIGFGIAIPHARCPKLSAPLVVFGRSTDGVPFDPNSTELVHLVFLLVTPLEQPDLQLLLLGQVARFVVDPENRRKLLAATTAAEVRDLLGWENSGQHLPRTTRGERR